MDFGRKIMEKYGYKEGSGLGKESNGITAPIKASFKFDQAGLGGKDEVSTQDHWWERVYTEATNNVKVDSSNGTISIDLNDKDGVEITNKSYSMKKLQQSGAKLQYGNFLKSATLLTDVGQEKDIEGHVSTTDIEIKPFQVVNDDELFKACDGRTAHKGARHGLNLSGKLQRIAEQEKLLLERMKTNKAEVFKTPTAAPSIIRKKPLIELNSSKDDSSSSSDDNLPLNLNHEAEDEGMLSKKQNKKKKYRAKHEFKNVEKIISKIDSVNLEQSPESQEAAADEDVKLKSLNERRKEKKSLKREFEQYVDESEVVKNKRKKKKKSTQNALDTDEEMIDNKEKKSPRVATPMRKKKKSKKIIDKLSELTEISESKRLLDDDGDTAMNDSENSIEQPKQKKAKKVKLSNEDDEDKIDKLNEEHHQNLSTFKIKAGKVESLNFESSSKKDKKKSKKKKKDKNFQTNDWEMKQAKKHEKIEKKKQKRLKNLERREEKKQKTQKELKKLAKKEAEVVADKMAIEINSLEFS